MFNIKDYLEEINCPYCKENSYRVIKNSDYSTIKDLTDLLKIYRSSGDDILFDSEKKLFISTSGKIYQLEDGLPDFFVWK